MRMAVLFPAEVLSQAYVFYVMFWTKTQKPVLPLDNLSTFLPNFAVSYPHRAVGETSTFIFQKRHIFRF